MTELEKWKRLNNPQTLADWGLGINLGKLFLESPKTVEKEILPYLLTKKKHVHPDGN